ncbi:MAG: M20/M25/M40 family metallo-hydrolase [Sphingomonadales bacterium]|nr:MAG: M20/M25/M40 family metallo-hydrolase [Sphingomonadales bacterium]
MDCRMSLRRPSLLVLLLLSMMLAACARAPVGRVPVEDRAEIAARLKADIVALADDEMLGRKPGTPGEDKTLAYLERRMLEVGLVSGTNDPGSYWRMPVGLVATRALPGTVTLTQGKRSVIVPESDAAVFTQRRRELALSGPGTGVPVVFVGYGDGLVLGEALAGAVVVMLADPGRDEARRAALFAQRATAVLTVVPDADALAPLRIGERREKLQLASEEQDTLSAFVTEAVVADLIGEIRWKRLKSEAEAADFAPLEIHLAVAIEAAAERREFTSYNLVGMIPGKVPGSGAVLLLAHWDHLGECAPPEAPDTICNGAADNASGLAAMLELAQRLNSAGPHGRDIYVLATTSEEGGLLGARAFAKAPPVPLASIVAAFNFDMVAVAPRGSPVGFIGRGRTAALDSVILDHLANNGRGLGDQSLADSFVQRQDGWALLQQGVPSVLLSSTYGVRGLLDPFLATRYHRPSDSADAVELGGAIDDVLLHDALIRQIADPARYLPPAAAAP